MNTNTLDNKQKKHCIFVKKNGDTCGALAMKNSDFCFFHNPETETKRQETKRKGGKSKVIVVKGKFPAVKIKKVSDVVKFLTDLINGVLIGEIDLRISTGLTYIANSVLKGLELSQVESRIDKLETKLNVYSKNINHF